MLYKYLSTEGLNKLVILCNKVWEEGRIPASWKEVVIVPIKMSGPSHQIIELNITHI